MELRRLFPVLVLLLLSALLPLASSRAYPSQAVGRPRPRVYPHASEFDCSKTSWPEVVGMTGEAARDFIQSAVPQCNWYIQIVPFGMMVTMDYRTDRIRIFVNADGIVEAIPVVG
ncbi:unnamed protein product [Closterium sp. Yama58-4]|nr:unnamed protein product [Closterium sp. Yama58-4]